MANIAYIKEWQKRKRREGKIAKLQATILSLKTYVRKVQGRSSGRKRMVADLRSRLNNEKLVNKEIKKLYTSTINSRVHNVSDLLLRAIKSAEQLRDEINFSEIVLLLYLYNIESASTQKLADVMSKDPRTITDLVFKLSGKEFLLSKKIGNGNYMYLTEEGKRVVKTFLEQIKQQQIYTL